MSNKEIYNLLKNMNLEVAYDHFNNKIEPPFIIYVDDDPDTFKADDKVYKKINNYSVYLVTSKKDVLLEEQLEELFDNNHIPYDKTQSFIDDERIYQIEYTI